MVTKIENFNRPTSYIGEELGKKLQKLHFFQSTVISYQKNS